MNVTGTAADKLTFIPSKSVTFMPNETKQMAEMTITNESDKTIMFKMKSTRPGMFKMRPVYGAVAPNDKVVRRPETPHLESCKEESVQQRAISADTTGGFTIVAAVAPSTAVDTEKIWKSHKYQEKLMESEVGKKKFRILFFGINDQEEDDEDEKKEAEEKSKKKGINEGDPEGADKDKAKGTVQKEKIVENVIVKKEVVQAPPKKLVMVMYRDQKCDSLSGDDDDDGADATTTPQPVGKGKSKEAVKSQSQAPQSAVKSLQATQAQSVKSQPPKPPAGPASAPPAPPPKTLTAQQQKQLTQLDEEMFGAKTCRINPNIQQRPAAPVPNK